MLELTLAIYYFHRFKTALSLKVLLYCVLLADAIGLFALYSAAWTVSLKSMVTILPVN